MVPFHPSFFCDDVILFRHAVDVKGRGDAARTFPHPGEPLRAGVSTHAGDRVDASGRTFTVTTHSLVTDEDIAARPDDRVTWKGRTLTVEVRTRPVGFGDVAWITPTVEEK